MEIKQEPQFFYATEDTYAIAAELSEQGFEELNSQHPYDECNAIVINPFTNHFEFSKNDIIEFTKKTANLTKTNLNTVEQWKTN